ncbi:GNAT family N-acetyltransferase [Chloroflexota bacterium]
MSVFPRIIRNYRRNDFDDYVRLKLESEALDETGRCVSERLLGEYLRRPNFVPDQDVFVAEAFGKLAGCLDITPEREISRIVLDCLIHPECRRQGLATEMYQYAVLRAQEVGARVAHVNIDVDNTAAKGLLKKLGFEPIRVSYELRLKLSETRLLDVGPLGPVCRQLQNGDEGKLAEIQNCCFVGHWGFNPNTVEDIVYRIGLSDCSLENVILAWQGEEPVGYCWTTMDFGDNIAPGERKGRIHMIGVLPEYQGEGIGRVLLLAGLSCLKSRQVDVVELTVHSENVPARALYESVGFKFASSSLWYQKTLD